jgi:hypothetical protein
LVQAGCKFAEDLWIFRLSCQSLPEELLSPAERAQLHCDRVQQSEPARIVRMRPHMVHRQPRSILIAFGIEGPLQS